MVKHIPPASIFSDKFCHRPHQAQLCSLLSPRHHLAQMLAQSLSIAKHRTSDPIQHKHRYCYQCEHSRPRYYAPDPRIGKSKQPFRIAESFFAAKAPRIFAARLLGTHITISQQVPDTPFAFSISLAALCYKQASLFTLAVTQSAKTSPSKVSRQAQMLELDPIAVETNLDVVFRTNDKANSQSIEQIDQFDIGKGAISRYQQAASGNRSKHLTKEYAHKVSFIATAATFKRVLFVGPPVQRYCAGAGAKRSDQEMLLIFNSPVDAEANCADQRQLRNDNASGLARHRIDTQAGIMKEASQSFASSLKVVEEASQRGLTATPGGDKRKHKIGKRVTLMT